jgi:hypothetical protein
MRRATGILAGLHHQDLAKEEVLIYFSYRFRPIAQELK